MKTLNKKRVAICALVLVFVVIIVVVVFANINKKKPDDNVDVKVEQEIKDYGYVLLENETTLYKDYFKELIEVLNAKELDEKLYASSVVKLFISDFYELNSKKTKNDIGGLQFVYDVIHDNFVLNAKDTIYKYVENNLNNDRTQKLPSVKTVNIDSVNTTSFTYNASSITDDNAYEVKASWEYNEDLGYQSSATFILMHVDKKLVIVEIK